MDRLVGLPLTDLSSMRLPVSTPHGNRYGDITVDGNSTVIIGDVHISNQPLNERDKQEQQRRALYTTLLYDGMYRRTEQLSLPQIPLQSFEWIWKTEFSSWLRGEEPWFWINGKPGSGKSTLMQYLINSNWTRELLNCGNRDYTVLNFFFDFRAGSTTANDSVGVLRTFLSQLCMCDKRLERRLAERNTDVPIDTTSIPALLGIFAEMTGLLGRNICAFVDGLDEYCGRFTDLGDLLTQIQDRTGIKLCVASRPEPTFKDLFNGRPSLKMQDHNAASVRTYIDHAIIKGRENMARVDEVFDEDIREEIQHRAQGVIIWARLAVDELLRAAYLNTPRHTLEGILEHLPDELEAMYERCLSRLRHTNTSEVALILFLLNEFDGSLNIDVFFGMWHFVCSHVTEHSVAGQSVKDRAGFVSRLTALIGTLLDILGESGEVRLMHKTLRTYLGRSMWIKNQLPDSFLVKYPDNIRLRIFADVIKTAMDDNSYSLEEALREKFTLERYMEKFTDVSPWQERGKFLEYGVSRFLSDAQALENSGVSSFGICRNAMSILVLANEKTPVYSRVWYRACRYGLLDLAIAVKAQLNAYVTDRLAERLFLDDTDWSELFGELMDEFCYQNRWNGGMLDLLRPYCGFIYPHVFMRCCARVDPPWDTNRHFPDFAAVLVKMKLIPSVRKNTTFGENEICGKEDDLLHWWIRRYAGGLDNLSLTILYLILESGESIHTRCKQGGTALHVLINEFFYDTTTDWRGRSCSVSETFATLIKLGIDPTIKHKGRTPQQLARRAEIKIMLRKILRIYKEPYPWHANELDKIETALRKYRDEEEWPWWVQDQNVSRCWLPGQGLKCCLWQQAEDS